MVGFPKSMWYENKLWWLVGLYTGPFTGGFLGSAAYDTLVFDGPESPINFPAGIKARALRFWIERVLHPIRTVQRFSRQPDPQRALDEEWSVSVPSVDDPANDNQYGRVNIPGQPAG